MTLTNFLLHLRLSMNLDKKSALVGASAAAAVLILAYGIYFAVFAGGPSEDAGASRTSTASKADGAPANGSYGVSSASPSTASIELSAQEFQNFKVEAVREHDFRILREAVGDIDFNREMSVD